MRAARLYGPGDLRVEDVPVPDISPGEALLRVKAAAVCGTDVRMYRNGAAGVGPQTPLILGHEVSGTLVAVGRDAAGCREGMRVAVAPNMGCGICDQCVSGNTQLCASYVAFGINLSGGFAEYMRIPQAAVRQGNVVEIPSGLDFISAALAEPLSCVYNAFQRLAIAPGDVVLVLGAGPIGLMHARLSLMAGAAKVIVNDVNDQRLQLAAQIEPRLITLGSEGLAGSLEKTTEGRGVSVCIVAAPSGEGQALALEVIGMNGRVMFFGGLPRGSSAIMLDTNLIHYKQLTVTGTSRSSLIQFRKSLGFVLSGHVVVKDLVTRLMPLADIDEALAQSTKARGLKDVIEFP